MGESRTELIQWLNRLLQINYTKVEQCGTGGAYCQVMDSIFGQHLLLFLLRSGTLVTATVRGGNGQATSQ